MKDKVRKYSVDKIKELGVLEDKLETYQQAEYLSLGVCFGFLSSMFIIANVPHLLGYPLTFHQFILPEVSWTIIALGVLSGICHLYARTRKRDLKTKIEKFT